MRRLHNALLEVIGRGSRAQGCTRRQRNSFPRVRGCHDDNWSVRRLKADRIFDVPRNGPARLGRLAGQ